MGIGIPAVKKIPKPKFGSFWTVFNHSQEGLMDKNGTWNGTVLICNNKIQSISFKYYAISWMWFSTKCVVTVGQVETSSNGTGTKCLKIEEICRMSNHSSIADVILVIICK